MPASIFTFFGLRENPFSISPDPRFIVLHPRAQAAWNDLIYAVSNRRGLILLTGEVGTGKTTLLRHLIDWLRSHKSPSALVVNSHLEGADLLDIVLSEFSILSGPQKTDKLVALQAWLVQRYEARQVPVLIIDEAQGLLPRVLEEIRLLLNLETSSQKLLQIVLSGQPELDEKLRSPAFAAVRQRIAVRCRTSPLKPEETHEYVALRLATAGAANSSSIFPRETLDAVHYYSRGVPRVINLLCEHSLISACARRCQPVTKETISEVAREFNCEPARPGAPHRYEPLFPGESELLPLGAPQPMPWSPLPSLGSLDSFPEPPPGTPVTAGSIPSAAAREATSRHKFSAARALAATAAAPARARALPARDPLISGPNRIHRAPVADELPEQSRVTSAPARVPLPWRQSLQGLRSRTWSEIEELRDEVIPKLRLRMVQLRRMSAEASAQWFSKGKELVIRGKQSLAALKTNDGRAGSMVAGIARVFPVQAWLVSLRRDWRRLLSDLDSWLKQPAGSVPPAQRHPDRRVGTDRRATAKRPSTTAAGSSRRSSSSS